VSKSDLKLAEHGKALNQGPRGTPARAQSSTLAAIDQA